MKFKIKENELSKLTENPDTQSIVFKKDKFSKSEAQSWLKSHGYKTSIDEKENTYRARQTEPGGYDHFATKEIKPGVSLVLGYK